MNPLEQLQDIALPEQIHSFPVAYGWWISLIVLSALLIYLGVIGVKHYQHNKAKKSAVKALLRQKLSAEQTLHLLKWCCLQYYSRQTVASLYGENFQDFLIKQLPLKHQESFKQLSKACFGNFYQKAESTKINSQALQDASKAMALFWLQKATLPKGNLTTKLNITGGQTK